MIIPADDGDLGRAWKLLVLCARIEMTADEESAACGLLAAGISWPTLLDLALRHKVLQLVAPHLIRLDRTGTLPFPARFMMKMYYEATKQRTAVLLAEGAKVLQTFQRMEITAVPLKGLLLAPYVYRDPGLRAMNDLDFLIPLDQRRAASKALTAEGYTIGEYELATGEIAEVSREVELSWRLHIGNLYTHVKMLDDPFAICARVDLSYDVDTEQNYRLSTALLAGTIDGLYGDVPSRILTDIDFAIHVAVHMFKEATNESWIRAAQGADMHLIKVCDLREFMHAKRATIDWNAYCERAEEIDAVAAVLHSVGLVYDVFEDALAEQIVDRLTGATSVIGDPR